MCRYVVQDSVRKVEMDFTSAALKPKKMLTSAFLFDLFITTKIKRSTKRCRRLAFINRDKQHGVINMTFIFGNGSNQVLVRVIISWRA